MGHVQVAASNNEQHHRLAEVANTAAVEAGARVRFDASTAAGCGLEVVIGPGGGRTDLAFDGPFATIAIVGEGSEATHCTIAFSGTTDGLAVEDAKALLTQGSGFQRLTCTRAELEVQNALSMGLLQLDRSSIRAPGYGLSGIEILAGDADSDDAAPRDSFITFTRQDATELGAVDVWPGVRLFVRGTGRDIYAGQCSAVIVDGDVRPAVMVLDGAGTVLLARAGASGLTIVGNGALVLQPGSRSGNVQLGEERSPLRLRMNSTAEARTVRGRVALEAIGDEAVFDGDAAAKPELIRYRGAPKVMLRNFRLRIPPDDPNYRVPPTAALSDVHSVQTADVLTFDPDLSGMQSRGAFHDVDVLDVTVLELVLGIARVAYSHSDTGKSRAVAGWLEYRARYEALRRNESTRRKLEAQLLRIYRVFGFGFRPGPPAAAWTIVTAIVACLALKTHHGYHANLFELRAWGNVIHAFGEAAILPAGWFNVSGDTGLTSITFSELGIRLARLAVSIPFLFTAVAVSRYGRIRLRDS